MHKIFPINIIFFHFILYFFFTAYEVKQPTVQAKLSAMRSQFPQVVAWIDKIPLYKWSQAYDGGHRYTHMTTNLAECMKSVLKGARSLPICALLKITFQNINAWFVERDLKADSMLRANHQYPEDVTALLQQNQQKSAYCHVQRYDRDNSEFEVQEILSPHHYQPKSISFTVRLND